MLCSNVRCKHASYDHGEQHCSNCGRTLVLKRRYTLESVLGTGGFGTTFKAIDLDCLNERVAIKLLHNRSATTEMLFAREAEQLQRLGRHPQISSLRASFEEHGDLFIVQDFVEGRTLEHIVEEDGVYSDNEVREFLRKTLPVVQYLHRERVIHRDIKPQNIIAKSRDAAPTLIDFGVVKLVETSLSGVSVLVISHGYTPPEQAAGKPVPSSDLFSLGRTCVFLLTGRNPIEFFDPVTGKCEWRRHAKVTPLLAGIIDRMVEGDPGKRFRSAEEVLGALTPKGCKRVMGVTVACVALIVSGVGAISLMNILAGESPEQPEWTGDARYETLITHGSTSRFRFVDGVGRVTLKVNSRKTFGQDAIGLASLESGDAVGAYDAFTGSALALSPDGESIAVDEGTRIVAYGVQDRDPLAVVEGTRGGAAYSRDSRKVALCAERKNAPAVIQIWDLREQERVSSVELENVRCSGSIAFSPDGSQVAVADYFTGIHVLRDGAVVDTVPRASQGEGGGARAVVAFVDNESVVYRTEAGIAVVHDLQSDEDRNVLDLPEKYVATLATSPRGSTLAAVVSDSNGKASDELWFVDLKTKETVSFPLPGIPSQGEPFFSSDGRSLYVVGAQRIDRWYMR